MNQQLIILLLGATALGLLTGLIVVSAASRRLRREISGLIDLAGRLAEGARPSSHARPLADPDAHRLEESMTALAVRLRQAETLAAQQTVEAKTTQEQAHHLAHTIIPLSLALTAEKNYGRLLRMILSTAQSFCHADAATLYLRTADEHLDPVVMQTVSLGLLIDGTSGEMMPIPPLALLDSAGKPNQRNITTYTAHTARSINVADVYADGDSRYDFSGPKAFDLTMGYRSGSFLTIPLKDNAEHVIGVLQLINAQNPHTREIVPFSPAVQEMAEAIAALAAAALIVYNREQRPAGSEIPPR